MKKATVKISSLILCGLLIYNSLGYFVVLSVMRLAVRQQKWAQLSVIPEQELITFFFTKTKQDSRLKIENSREILVDGKLYDVVRKYDDGKQIKYSCIYDHEEESLISKTRIFNSKAQQMPLENTTRNIIDKIIKTGVFTEKNSLIPDNPLAFYTLWQEICYSGPTIQISPPPPQRFS